MVLIKKVGYHIRNNLLDKSVLPASLLDKCCPILEKTIIVKDRSPWFNGELARKKKEKRRKECKWRRLNTESTWEEYKNVKNENNELIKVTKVTYYRRKIQEAGSDMNKLYKLFNSLTGNIKKKKLPDGFTDKELADAFCVFFKNKISVIVSSFVHAPIQPVIDINIETRLLCFNVISKEELINILKRAKKTHCDYDPMPISEIVEAENFCNFVDIILMIVNCSISSHRFPKSEKRAIVKPILKGKLDHQELSSYRPVSNLSFLSKVLEYVIERQLVDYLERSRALSDFQSAYRQFFSTETVICSVVSDLLELMDNSKCGILVLLDLSAAFDTVVHELLLNDLRAIGVVGEALEYLESYLQGREYCVQIGNCFSSQVALTTGVPQGSVLGPILFCIYTIGLSEVLRRNGVQFRLFADDTQLYFAITDLDDTMEKISDVLRCIKEWMDCKHLKLNESKTEYMLVGKKENLRYMDIGNIFINGSQIQIAESVRDLGVLLDCNLNFDCQIKNVLKTTGYHLRNIAFIKKYLDEDSVKKLVINSVITRVDYCNSVYYKLPKFQLKKLQGILNRSARLIKGISSRERITPVLIELHWLPIKARIIFKLCVLTHQALVTGCPPYIREMLQVMQPLDGVNTRRATSGITLFEPRCSLCIGSRSFKFAAPRVYNSLPQHIREIEDIRRFKMKLKTFLFSDCYDLDDSTISEQYAL